MPCSYCEEGGHNIRTCPIYLGKRKRRMERNKVRQQDKEHKLLKKENQKLKSKTEKQDKTIRRLRKKITEKNKTTSRETALMACWISELREALEDSNKKNNNCNEEELTCSICYDIINTNKNITKTECGHCFHTKCLMNWIGRQKKNSCPNCRQLVY